MTLIDTTTDALGTAATNVTEVAEDIAASAASIASDAYEAAARRESWSNRLIGLAAVIAVVVTTAIVLKRFRSSESSDTATDRAPSRDAATSPLRAAG